MTKTAKAQGNTLILLAGGAIVVDVIANDRLTAGNVYQAAITGLSLIPGGGLIVGGAALMAEGISRYFTGRSVSENINNSLNGGVILDW